MNDATRFLVAASTVLLVAAVATAQTSSPGAGIDLEVVNPVDGSNNFCVQPGQPFWAHVFVRPGDGTTSCQLGCGTVAGGTASIAAAVVSLAFDPGMLSLQIAETNPDPGSAAVNGLIVDGAAASGRVGWALAGDWLVDGDPSSGLATPCAMQLLDTAGWVFRVQLTATSGGTTLLAFRRRPDFELSFADLCSADAFSLDSGDVDEVLPGYVTSACSSQADIVFVDGFEIGNPSRWTSATP